MAKRIVFIFLFFLLCAGTLFLYSTQFVNAQTAPKWYCFYFGVSIMVGLSYLFKFSGERCNVLVDSQLLLSVILLCCFVQSLYGIGQFIGWFQASNGFRITGSFDNPAGFAACLCAGMPFFWYFILGKNPFKKWLSIMSLIIVGVAVVLSASRAGIISFLSVLLLIGFHYLPFGKTKKILLSAIIFLGLIVALYYLKKDSANGRLLIWQCSWIMIKDKPLLGYGQDGFKANYMNYQAKYFEEHPDSKYAMLAGNVNRPFNEYIGLVVNYGLVGLILLLASGWFIWKSYLRCKNNMQARMMLGCLLSIVVFALFSYPLDYPFVWIVGISSIAVILYQAKYSIRIPKVIVESLKLLLIPVFCIIILCTYQRMIAEMRWCYIAHQSLLGKTEQMLPWYKQLHQSLSNNELFLYNYSVELNVTERYEESLQIAHECERLWADYDLQMLMADNYQHLKKYDDAERHYRKAAAMCPVKFMPLYRLFQLYEICREKEKVKEIAKMIEEKPVKVMSPTILEMKQKVKQKIY